MPRDNEELVRRLRIEGLVTVAEAERITRFDESTIRRWAQAGDVLSIRHGGRVFVKLASLEKRVGKLGSAA